MSYTETEKKCPCHELMDKIGAEFPDCDGNMDEACEAWLERSADLPNTAPEYDPDDPDTYMTCGCTCPACGREVCGWCGG
jgi:hypothetical protein